MTQCACGCGTDLPAKRGPGREKKWASGACCSRAKHIEYRAFIDGYKAAQGGCSRCGIQGPPYILEFHHVDPTQKSFELGKGSGKRRSRVEAELAKCIVLCANCHRIVEHG